LKQTNCSCCKNNKKQEKIITRKDNVNSSIPQESQNQIVGQLPQEEVFDPNAESDGQELRNQIHRQHQVFDIKSESPLKQQEESISPKIKIHSTLSTIISLKETIENTNCKCLGIFNEMGEGTFCANKNNSGTRFCYVNKNDCEDIVITKPQNARTKALADHDEIHYSFDICHKLKQQKINKLKKELEKEEKIVDKVLKNFRKSHKKGKKMVKKMSKMKLPKNLKHEMMGLN
jgi:hypothetical protein